MALQDAPSVAQRTPDRTVWRALMPHRLRWRLMAVVSLCLVLSIFGYGTYMAKEQADLAHQDLAQEMAVMAQNLAAISAHFLVTEDLAQLESAASKFGANRSIQSLLVTDTTGKPIVELRNINGHWTPNFDNDPVLPPRTNTPILQSAMDSRSSDTDAAWHPVEAGTFLGWARVSFQPPIFSHLVYRIWRQSLWVVALSCALALALLATLLRTTLRALETATGFAHGLDQNLGQQLTPYADVTELEALGQALNTVSKSLKSKADEVKNRQFALNQHAIVAGTDVNSCLTYVNDKFCEISGYTRAELIGHDHQLLTSGTHSDDFFQAMADTLANGHVWYGEVCNRAKDGTLYWLQTTMVPTPGDDGKPVEYTAISANITMRKVAEQELIHNRDNLTELVAQKTIELHNSVQETKRALFALEQQRFVIDQHAIVTLCGRDGRITYGNDKFTQISGYSREEYVGKDHKMVNSGYHPKGFFKEMYRTILSGEVWHAEVCNRAKDGSLYWVHSTTAAFMDESGKPREYIAVRTDITERKRAEEGAKAASRAKTDFLANMSHEIRTPMNGVIGMVDILQTTHLNPEQHRMLGTIHDSSVALLHIINDILDYSKIEAGKLEIESIPMHLARVAEGVVQLMNTAANTKGIALSVSVSPALPAWMLGDPNRLRQVLLNLLGNALKFTATHADRQGQVTLHVAPCTLSAGNAGVRLRVVDNGIGMTEAVMAKLFQPFTQADESTARKFGGTGLGLSITQRLVELMQGRITVSSALGEGSEFAVEFPLRPCAAGSAQAHESIDRRATARGNATHRDRGSRSKQLILLAEDNPTNRDVMQEQLRLQGYACEVAEDGALALAMWQKSPSRYALLLTDCHMPNLDGFGLTEAIRAQEPAGTHLPIIAVTANAMQGESQRCRDHGMDDYLSKPLRLTELAAMLAKWVPEPVPAMAAQPPVARDFAVWNPSTLTELVGDNPSMHRRLLEKFLVNAQKQVTEITAAAAANDTSTLAGVAHTLKSAARSVGALALGEQCQSLESAGRAGDAPSCQPLATGLTAVLAHAAAQINSHLAL
jgi:PAS domain S-box-containing protein